MIRAVARKSIPGIMEGLRILQSLPKSPRVDYFLKRSANCILEVGGYGGGDEKYLFEKTYFFCYKLSKSFFRSRKAFRSAENGINNKISAF